MDCCLSAGAYVVAAVYPECGSAQDRHHDFNSAHDPKLAYEFSSIGVLIFWFACYHTSSLDVLRSAFIFNSPCC